LVNFQIDELTKASVRIGEEAELDAERRKLESVRMLMETGQNALTAITESDNSIISSLSQIDKELGKAAAIDKQLAEDAESLSAVISSLNDLTRHLEGYLSGLEDNPARLEEINCRLAELYRLRKKYGADEAGLLAKLDELNGQSLGAADYDTLIKNLSEKLAAVRSAYFHEACEISEKRKAEASRLEKAVEKHLADLALEKARFKIDFQTELDENGFEVDGERLKAFPHGFENIEFLISTNPNEPIRPLVKIASGGEISRIMLALLSVIAGKYRLPTIIFDEIDTGIGGQTALKLAEKLKELADRHQVIVISHLPAVAARADHHIAVSKTTKAGRNIITVKEITGKELKTELSRMAGKAMS
jgi:DNA repair protein RecN (Recombination protein N)